MKKFYIVFLLIIIVAATATSQEDWHWQNPIPQGNELNDIWMFSSQVILAVGDIGTVIKSTDGGINWSVTHYCGGITSDLYTVFFINQNIGWAAGEMGNVLKTTDGGISWSAKTTMDSLAINGLYFHDSQNGWAAGTKVELGDQKGVILKTTDGGATWITDENTGAKSLNNIRFFNDNVGWAVGSRYQTQEDIILRTGDGGTTWQPYYSGNTTELYCACFVDSLHGWAVGKRTTSSSVIIHTNDSGINWTAQNQPGSDKVLWAIAFRDQNLGWAVGASGLVLKTVNGGSSWDKDGVTIQASRNLKALGFTNSQMVMSVGNAGIIVKSQDDGTVWQEISSGTTTWHFYAIDFADPDTGWIVGPNKTILRSIDGGENWDPQASSAPQNLLDICMVDNMTGWTVGEWGVTLKTTSGGINDDWIEQNSGTNDFLHSCFFLNDQVGWLCGGPVTGDTSIILHTTDGGSQWIKQNCPASVSLRAIHFVDDQNGWAVGENGNVVQTTDGGANWSLVNVGRMEDFYSVYFLTNDIGWIGGNSILHTSDGGANWDEQQTFSANYQVRSIEFIDLLIGWAAIQGNSGALYKTMNGGLNWFKLEIGTANNLFDIDIVNEELGWVVGTYSTILKTDAVFVPVELTSFTCAWIDYRVELSWATASELNNYGFEIERKFSEHNKWESVGFVEGNGTTTRMNYYSFADSPRGGGKYNYRLKQVDIDGKFKFSPIREVVVPSKFALHQNHPNPFNPRTAIGFELPANAHVILEIYNMLGQKIATLIDERRPAGFQQVTWDGTDNAGKVVGSGVYFYYIKSGRFEATKKLVLLR